MDLIGIKVGDKVRSVTKGWLEVEKVDDEYFYAKKCSQQIICIFQFDGKVTPDDVYPEIVEWEPKVQKWGKWEPKDYNNECYCVNLKGNSCLFYGTMEERNRIRLTGNMYDKRHEAEEAEDFHRKNRLIWQYVKEYISGWKPDWYDQDQFKFYVFYDTINKTWLCDFNIFNQKVGIVYMSKLVALQLCDDLNSGRVVLK